MARYNRKSGRNSDGGYDLSSASDQQQTSRYSRGSSQRSESSRYQRANARPERGGARSANDYTNRSARSAESQESGSEYSRTAGRYTASRASGGSGKKRAALIVALVLAVILVGCGVAAALWYGNIMGNLNRDEGISNITQADSGEPYYVLLLGGDSRADSKEDNRTDSIMVARVDEQNKKVSILSIPRDTRIKIEGHGYCKLNSAIEYGGYDQVITEVNEMLGIKINYYAFIYFSGFKDLVDKLGGVTVEVPEGTYYNNVTVPAGEAVQIDGTEALTLARCRHGNPPDQGAYAMGDYQRTLNQRNLIKAIAKKILASDVSAMPSLIEGLSQCVSTNMGADKILSLAQNMKGMNVEQMDTAQVPDAGASIDGQWFAVIFDDVFQEMLTNFRAGDSIMKGLDKFDSVNCGNDVGSDYIDGPLYSTTSYEDKYGDFHGSSTDSASNSSDSSTSSKVDSSSDSE